jgi:hypothetical protein
MARGGYTFEQIRSMSDVQLMFLDHWQEKDMSERDNGLLDKLASLLGVYWDLSELPDEDESSSNEDGTVQLKSNKLFIPLTVAIQPNLLKSLKERRPKTALSAQDAGGINPKEIRTLDEMPENMIPAMLRRPKKPQP